MEEKYVKKMEELEALYGDDVEMLHVMADNLLCNLLEELGYEKVTQKFKDFNKWYG
jgi:hypothetical protein